MEEEVVNYDQNLADLNMQENTFSDPEEKDGIGEVKETDEILKQELGSNSDVQLKNIVRTIQKEQNAIIRNRKDQILVIQGVAGSGKTSVALHRVAYLLYHDREHLKASNVLILSPNSVFSDYISHILPELGEENIL